MDEKAISEIKALAVEIDRRIILFDGYSPKPTDQCEGECLFWREITNAYGLLADCDRVQIKGQKNLAEIMTRYQLIEKSDYNSLNMFWKDVSVLRGWFCHNCNSELFYIKRQEKAVKEYLKRAFPLASQKPEKMEGVIGPDWDMLAYNIQSRFDEYLAILKRGIMAWKSSADSKEILDEWIDALAESLFLNSELIDNVLVELADFVITCQNLNNVKPHQLAKVYRDNLKGGTFSQAEIKDEIIKSSDIRSGKMVVMAVIRDTLNI